MNQIQMWQLLVDIGLITSVLTMTVRAFKSSRLPSMLPKTRELETSLRSLIADAETAGLNLNDQLLRREQNIQRALAEIQQSEARIAKAIAEAEALQNKLQQTRAETVKVIQDLKSGFERGVQAELSRLEEQSVGLQSAHPQVAVNQRVVSQPAYQETAPYQAAPSYPAPPSHHAAQSYQAAQSFQPPQSYQAPPSQPSPQIPPAFVAQTYTRTPLQRTVETTNVSAPAQPALQGGGATRRNASSQPSPAELQQVYKSAEAMIKQGQPLETVATQMKLPVEGVRLLAQMIEIEREEETRKQEAEMFAGTDSRLGALAAIRRQTSVL